MPENKPAKFTRSETVRTIIWVTALVAAGVVIILVTGR